MPVVVHEFVHHAVSKDEMAPQLFNNRSKLWRVLLPPDQLNPEGYVDARLDNFSPLEVGRPCHLVFGPSTRQHMLRDQQKQTVMANRPAVALTDGSI
jgi:hypothetical protein